MSDDLERRVFEAVQRHAAEGLLPPAAGTVGLGLAEMTALSLALGVGKAGDGPPGVQASRPQLLLPLIALLWTHRTGETPWTRLMAGTIACAAFGARHLWQDLGASGRPEVTALMERHFRALAERNVHNLKWKNHLFRSLGAELGMPDLRPPRCDGCEEQPVCFPDRPVEVVIRRAHAGSAPQEERSP